MEHVVKSFTLIDFLGIFSPGAIFVLAFQFYTGALTLPFISFFGENDLMLAAYFVFLSYLAGTFLHQLGAGLEKICCKKNMHIRHWENEKVAEAYCARINPKRPATPMEQANAGKEIFHYIQRNHRPQRVMIFSAFYTMSRTLTVTFLLIIMMVYFFLENWLDAAILIGGCGLFTVLSVCRWRKFEQKCVDEAYLLFITEERAGKGEKPNDNL